jgi:hypothetical protein
MHKPIALPTKNALPSYQECAHIYSHTAKGYT